VHGVLTARALKRGGYSNVVIYEKEDALAGWTESFEADGHIFDYTTKFIPADTVDGPGIPPNLNELIQEYGLTVRPYEVQIKNYLYTANVVYPLPEVLLPYTSTLEGQQLLVGNLIAGFELLKLAASTGKAPVDLIEAGIVLKTETWAQFSERIQLPAFTDLCTFLHDTFLGGPATVQPAATVLNVRTLYMPSYIKAILSGLGIKSDTSLPISDELRSLLANPFPGTAYVVNEGYQAVFDAIVLQEGIEVCLGCEVTKIKKTNKNSGGKKKTKSAGGQVDVYASSTGKRSFDHIIITSRPHDSMGFLHGHSTMKELVSEAADEQTVTTFAFRAESTPSILGDPFVALIYPGSSTFPRDGTVTGIAKDHSDSNVCVAIAYAEPGASEEEGVIKVYSDLELYGMPVSAAIGFRNYVYPSVPRASAVADDWFAKMKRLQGVDEIYFVGEALSGFGVPTALNFVSDFVDKYFAHEI
jgi:hypothetical protein